MFPLDVPVKSADEVDEIKTRLKDNGLGDAKVSDVNNGLARVLFPNRKRAAQGKMVLNDKFAK